jgi:DNA replication protein
MTPMRQFKGFPAGKNGTINVPIPFFSALLPLIDDLAELKLTVYCFWALQQREGFYRYMRLCELLEDKLFLEALDADPERAAQELHRALERATERGTLLHVVVPDAQTDDHLYFMNTERGRRAVAALERGDWQPGKAGQTPVATIVDQPNIFALYEQNIGPLTPMLSDMLRDAENTYPAGWIVEAMQIAVESNKRSWRYIEAILKRWITEGKPGQYNRSEDAENPYLRDEYFRRHREQESK